MAEEYLDKAGALYLTQKLRAVDSEKVDKVAGKGLSTNDFTNEYKTKLDNIDKIDLDTEMSDTSENAVQNKVIKSYVDSKTISIYKPQGSINFSALPATGMEVGDVYDIKDAFTTDARFLEGAGHAYPAGTNIVYTNSGLWDALSGTIDLSEYMKKTDMTPITEAEIDAMFT